ncbi:MAG TPA: NnrS family protein, partial [Thermoanaerobaculia bacterium]
LSHRQIHGHTQILGFAALFLMGIAYHALPRILGVAGSLPKTRFSPRTAFWLMASGVIARNLGQPLGFYPAGRALSLLSGFLETAAAALFVSFVFGLLGKVREGKYDRKDPLLRFVRTGTLFFALAMAVNAVQSIWLAGHVEAALPVRLTEPFFAAAVYGFLLAWIYGFGNRVVTLFLGLSPARRGTPEAALWTQAAGVILSAGSWIPGLPDGPALLVRDAGLCLLAVSALVYLAGNGFLWRRSVFAVPRVPGTPSVAIRCAFGCLGLWALLEIAAVVVSRTTRLPAQNPWWSDAARHTFTVGFLTLVIIGMSFRILPVFSGKSLWSPRLAQATYALILLGTAMRLLQYPAAFNPLFYRIGAYMGIPVVLALLLFTFNLMRTMRAKPAMPPGAPEPRSPRSFVSTLPAR